MSSEDIYNKKFSSFSYVEVRKQADSYRLIRTINGEVVSTASVLDKGYSVRFFNDGTLYFSSSNNPENLGAKPDKIQGWEKGFDDQSPSSGNFRAEEEVPISSKSIREKEEILKNLYQEASSQPLHSKLKSLNLDYVERVEEKDVTINGISFSSYVPRVLLSAVIVMKNERMTVNGRFEYGGSGGLEHLREVDLKEKVKALDDLLVKGKSVEPGSTNVVVSGNISGIMAHESVGHPFEADRILGREFAQAGLSYLTFMKGRIGSDAVTVIDDPTIKKSNGYYEIDDEGVKAKEKVLIKEGNINELLHDRFSGYRMDTRSNGSGRASSHSREPLVRMSNTFFKPGKVKFHDLIDVSNGVFIKSYMEWNIDDMRLGQRYVGLEAYEIKHGEVGDPLLFPVLEGNTDQLLKSVEEVDDSLQFFPGTCGKGDPDQPVPVWLGGPDMLLNYKVRRI